MQDMEVTVVMVEIMGRVREDMVEVGTREAEIVVVVAAVGIQAVEVILEEEEGLVVVVSSYVEEMRKVGVGYSGLACMMTAWLT